MRYSVTTGFHWDVLQKKKNSSVRIFGVPTRYDPCITWLLLRSVTARER